MTLDEEVRTLRREVQLYRGLLASFLSIPVSPHLPYTLVKLDNDTLLMIRHLLEEGLGEQTD